MKNRIANLRVLSTLCIVLYHVCCPYVKWYWKASENQIIGDWGGYFFEQILSDKMLPTFFLLSGVLYYSNLKRYTSDVKSTIWKKFNRLIIPFALLSTLCHYLDLASIGIANADGHLWFLLILFSYFCISLILYRVKPKWHIVIGFIMYGCWVLLGKAHIEVTYLLGFLLKYYLFFTSGHLVAIYWDQVQKRREYMGFFSFILWMIVLILGIRCLIPIIFNFLIVVFAKEKEVNNRIWKMINNNSFGIYLLHHPLIFVFFSFSYVQNIYMQQPFIAICCMFMLILSSSCILCGLLHRMGFKYF